MTVQNPEKPVIGIVGGIGAGKSLAAAEFARLGCALLDADAIGHELLADESVRNEIRARWGGAVFTDDGAVSRDKLGRIVFADADQLAVLSRILHPRIRAKLVEGIAAAQRDPTAAAVLLDAAVLFEAGWDKLCTHRIFVEAPEQMRVSRTSAARGWDRQTLLAREKMQISLDRKCRKCDYTIDNSSSASCLCEQIRTLFNLIVQHTVHPR
ncbi:MAG: dephospho-CoA kinase [Planctomycetota bacterium]|nr:dephospho-CoA kinase [Planctomycetota bacterium]